MPAFASAALAAPLLSAFQTIAQQALPALLLVPLLTLAVSLCWPLLRLLLPGSALLRTLAMAMLLAGVWSSLPQLAPSLQRAGQWVWLHAAA